MHFAGRARPGPRAPTRRGGARERRHDPQPARGLPRARRRSHLPVQRARRDRASTRRLRAVEAARGGGLRAPSRRATVVRLTSVFGPGQVGEEGATGAIAAFAARALAGEPIVIPGNPGRGARLRLRRRRGAGAGADRVGRPLERDGHDLQRHLHPALARPSLSARPPARLADRDPGRRPARGRMRPTRPSSPLLAPIRPPRPPEGIQSYVDWLRSHPASQGSA